MVDHAYPYVLYTLWWSDYNQIVLFGAGTVLGDMQHGPVRWYTQATLGM